MLPEIGQLALAIAFALAVAQGILPLIGAHAGNNAFMASARPAALAQFCFLLLAFILLAISFINHDFSVRYVAENSNLQLPVLYRIAAVWGGHEGSLLLWVLMIAGWGGAVALRGKAMDPVMHARALAVMGIIGAGFLLFTIFTSSPFARLAAPPADGTDLNPLLQDPGLIFHPPLLYMGYVGFAVAFAFSIAALLGDLLDDRWLRWVRPWTNLAWMFLTCGIALGSWWAYNELGWGGWWFWDPVENASLMPWLAGTALIHSLAVSDKRGLFKSWSVLLAVLAFSLSLLGTFLVRSGILTSVHAFASDPARGLFILLLLVLVVGSSLLLYARRAPQLAGDGQYSPTSREMFLLANSVLMVAAVFIVMLGTIYPLALDALGGAKISVGPPYFNSVMLPIALPVATLIGLAMHARWRSDKLARLVRSVWLPLAACALAALAMPVLLFDQFKWQAAIGAGLAGWIAASALASFASLLRSPGQGALSRISSSRAQAGMTIAHIGVALFIVGVSFTSYYGQQRDVRLEPRGEYELDGFLFRFDKVTLEQGPNYEAQVGALTVVDPAGNEAALRPEKRHYPSSTQPLTEAAIDVGLTRDIYVSLGEERADGSWSARLQLKPFIRWIWGGAVLMALGAFVAATDRRYRRLAQQDRP